MRQKKKINKIEKFECWANKKNRPTRIGLGIAFIIFGIIGGFIPILQGWIFITLGLILIFGERITKYLKKQTK